MRRIGTENSATRTTLLDETEQLLLREGYAAVTTRRVAKLVGLTPSLVHYYFPTTEDLLVAVYRRAVDKTLQRLRDALASERPLRALWTLNNDADCTALAMEFMALSNHRKEIKAEIAHSAEEFRKIHADGLAKIFGGKEPDSGGPLCTTVIMAGISRLFVMEQALGTTLGHDEAKAAVEAWLSRVEQELGL